MGQDDKKQGSFRPKKDETVRKYRYRVLYTNVLKQSEVCFALKKALPGNRGIVFYPCMECYRRDAGGKMEIRPIFPGYIFIRSDMRDVELHEFIRNNCGGIMAFVRELKLSQRKAAGEEVFADLGRRRGEDTFSDENEDKNMNKNEDGFPGSGTDGIGNEEYAFSDLTEKEAEFLDFLLDAEDTGAGGKMCGSANVEDTSASGEACGNVGAKDAKNDVPAQGLLKMSYGYQEGNQYKVMKGPLRAYEDHIAGVNKHDKKAFLDFKINGKVVRAGFDVMPKRHWFPEDKETPEVLADGTEVDLQALAKAMMG